MINVKIIADTTFGKKRVTTFELEYPRYIHAEVMTHRVFSRNAASSRAIPIAKMIEQVRENTVLPTWTQNEAGMQGKLISNGRKVQRLNELWLNGANAAMAVAEGLAEEGAHKQNANRVLEPYQHIKVVLTGADFDNFFNLRFHPDAQPEIEELAAVMFANYSRSIPKVATENKYNVDGWHLPYADSITDLNIALKVSASCCAQVSYRKNDTSEEKAEIIFDRLVGSEPRHSSPMEHQCRNETTSRGNFGLVQFRQLIEDGEYN